MEQRPKPGRKSARQEALATGATHYIGPPCGRCRGRKRYTVCGGCVRCRKAQAMRRQAERRRAYDRCERYGLIEMGDPCVQCGRRARYVRSGGCVSCRAERSRRNRQDRAGSTISAGGLPVVDGGKIVQPGGN
ncbi:MAG: hypothetical protein ACK52I_06955 [Pseudomonadota bacterium]